MDDIKKSNPFLKITQSARIIMQTRLFEITQQIDLLYKTLEEKKPSPLSSEALLHSKLLSYKTLIQNPEINDYQIYTCLLSIERALRAMIMLSENSQIFNSTRSNLAEENSRSRFAEFNEEDKQLFSFPQECQKLQEMIQFYCVPRSQKQNGISRCLGESYNNLFTTKAPIFLLTFLSQQDAELFIKSIQTSKKKEIQEHFTTLDLNEFIQVVKDKKTYFHFPVSSVEKKFLEANGILPKAQNQLDKIQNQPLQYSITFKTEEEGSKCISRLNQSRDQRIRSTFPANLNFQKVDSSFGIIINEKQYTALSQWAPSFITSASINELALDLQKKVGLAFTPIIKTYNSLRETTIFPFSIQEEAVNQEKSEILFFELTTKGFQIYCAQINNIKKLKTILTHFGFKRLEEVTEATPPSVPGFDQHQQYLIIPHTQIAKLLSLHYFSDKPQDLLNSLYKPKKLDPQKCRYLDRQAKVFEETDADFYKEYFAKLLAVKSIYESSNHPIINSLFKDFAEDTNYDVLDPRRYILALLELQSQFYAFESECKQLPNDMYQLLDGLKSILIIAENDELTGISSRLSRHFHQLYEIVDMNALAPYVLFESTGCCFYFSSVFSLNIVANQFKLHGIETKIIEKENLNRDQNHKVPTQYAHKLIVPIHSNHQLLRLARFHPSNISVSLKQAYSNQNFNFTSALLSSSSICETDNSKKINPCYSVASLANGDQILQLSIATVSTNIDHSMGHVIILLDDSGSMAREKMTAAVQACINLILKLPENTLVTLIPFCAKPLFEACQKAKLPVDWINKIKAVEATGGTPLVETIVKAAAGLSTRCFTPMHTLKESTFILLTDGQGDNRETAEEILRAVQTGVFRGRDVSKCNHALGTPELPNYTPFPIIPVGIGNAYDSNVIDGLSSFAGKYHVREDDNMQADLTEMTDSITQTFGCKIGPVYAGLLDNQTGKMLITIEIDMMLPATSRCAYIRLPKDQNVDNLQGIIFLESELSSTSLTKIDDQNILVDYYRAQVDALFEIFAAKATAENCIGSSASRFATSSRMAVFMTPEISITVKSNSLFSTKESKFADIQKQLDALKYEIKENGINSPMLFNRIENFEISIKKAESNILDLNDLRRQQAEGSRFERGLGQRGDENMRNRNQFK